MGNPSEAGPSYRIIGLQRMATIEYIEVCWRLFVFVELLNEIELYAETE